MNQRRLYLAGAMTALLVLLSLALGTWQLYRLAWKNELIAGMQERLAAPAQPLPAMLDEAAALDYRRFAVRGIFDHTAELHLAARSLRGNVGWQVLSPVRLTDGRWLLVNRGWVPHAQRQAATRQAGQITGVQTIRGIVRHPPGRSWLQPDNEPATNVWFWVDVPAMAAQLDRPLLPVVLEADATTNPGGLPIGGQTRVAYPNNHLIYALTWYSMALIALVIFILWWRQYRMGASPNNS